MKKVLITGAAGQLGSDLVRTLNGSDEFKVHPITRAAVDCRDEKSVKELISALSPDIVIHCAAYVRVDDCEDEIDECMRVNAAGSAYVARAAAENGSLCVYISTDYVFDGKKRTPYSEDDITAPVNMYGISKLAGENAVRAYADKHLIIRSSGLYGRRGSRGKGGNFVETMLHMAEKDEKITVVDDQVLSPTFSEDLAQAISEIMRTDNCGTYHITNGGECSWYGFAKEIFTVSGLEPECRPTDSLSYGARAARPSYSVLSCARAEAAGVTSLRDWREALRDYLNADNGGDN